MDGETEVKGCGRRGETPASWPCCFSMQSVQGLSVVASLVMPLKEGTQERGFQCHGFPKELNVPQGNNSQGSRKHILSTINTRESQEILFQYHR